MYEDLARGYMNERAGAAQSRARPHGPRGALRTLIGTVGLQDLAKEPAGTLWIDVLSGTSAGGINAIFLGKALVNDQDLTHTPELWVEQGDIAALINDRSTYDLPGLTYEAPPKSLLNGDRFLLKLFYAFKQMDEEHPAADASDSPLVDELDLRVTTTDVRGLPVSLKLAGGRVVWENEPGMSSASTTRATADPAGLQSRHECRLLAARSTASFPVASARGSKMCTSLTPAGGGARGTGRLRSTRVQSRRAPRWDSPPSNAYDREAASWTAACSTTSRSVTQSTLSKRSAIGNAASRLHRARRSIPRTHPSPGSAPTQSTRLAALNIPRKETMSGPGAALGEIGRRCVMLIGYMDASGDLSHARMLPHFGDTGSYKARLAQLGHAFASYHRFRVATLTDLIACRVAESAGYGINSPEFFQVRAAIREWRSKKYPYPMRPDGEEIVDRETELDFLIDDDPDFRIRRLRLVLRMCDRLISDDDFLRDILQGAALVPRPQLDKDLPDVAGFRSYVADIAHDERS
jgi:hypothetical protein